MSTSSTGYAYQAQTYVEADDSILVSIATIVGQSDDSKGALVLGIQQAIEDYLTANSVPFQASLVQKVETTTVVSNGDVSVSPPVWQ